MKTITRMKSKPHAERGRASNLFRGSAVLLGFLAYSCSVQPKEDIKFARPVTEAVTPRTNPSAEKDPELVKKEIETMVVVQPSRENTVKISALALDTRGSDAENLHVSILVIKRADIIVEYHIPGAKDWMLLDGCEHLIADRAGHAPSKPYTYYYTTCDISSLPKASAVTLRATFIPKAHQGLIESQSTYEIGGKP